MKIRNGFVTNSSSTSYICEITGEQSESVWDSVSAQEMGYAICSNNHMFLEDFVIEVSNEEILEWLKTFREDMHNWYQAEHFKDTINKFINTDTVDEENREEFIEWCRTNIGEYYDCLLPIECPICQMEEFSICDLQTYLDKKANITDKEVLEYVKSKNKRRRRTYPIDHTNYALVKLNTTMEELKNEIRKTFSNYNEFREYVYNRGACL